MDCRTYESCNRKRNQGFRLHNVINTKEQTVYFHKQKLGIEVDELGHADRNLSNKIERQKASEKELVCLIELILMKKISIFPKK